MTTNASHCNENLSLWCCLKNSIKIKGYLLQVTLTFCTNLVLTSVNGRISISPLLIYPKKQNRKQKTDAILKLLCIDLIPFIIALPGLFIFSEVKNKKKIRNQW